jgi:hypothetical protein
MDIIKYISDNYGNSIIQFKKNGGFQGMCIKSHEDYLLANHNGADNAWMIRVKDLEEGIAKKVREEYGDKIFSGTGARVSFIPHNQEIRVCTGDIESWRKYFPVEEVVYF